MATTILALLLGITMTVLFFLIWFVRNDHKFTDRLNQRVDESLAAVNDRVSVLERRKAVIAEAVASQPKPVGVAAIRPRAWNEDAPPVEETR